MPRSYFVRFVAVFSLLVWSAAYGQTDRESSAELLFQAARSGDVEKIEQLLSAGVDVNSKTPYGGTALAFAAERGRRERIKGFGSLSFVASPVAADGYIFVTSEDGQTIVIKAGQKYEALHANPLGESVLASAAIANGTFVIRGHEHLVAVRQKE